jgi:hypothetical protein
MKDAKTPGWASRFHLLAEKLGLQEAIRHARERS